jgi:hypothetical protein
MIESLLYFLTEAPDIVFWASALFGTTLFFMRLCVTMIGGLSDECAAGDDLLEDGGDDFHHQTGSFKLFTLHSLSGFFMMFGWVGLACTKQLHYSHQVSMLYSLFAGGVTMILTAFIFKWSRLLVSSGTRFTIEKTVGLVGMVYQRISGNELGKIQVVVDGVTRELLALSCDDSDIESFCLIRVVKVLDYETVMVQRV